MGQPADKQSWDCSAEIKLARLSQRVCKASRNRPEALRSQWVIRDRSIRHWQSGHVRFAPKADMRQPPPICPLSAKSGHAAPQQDRRYSITSSETTSRVCGTMRLSVLALQATYSGRSEEPSSDARAEQRLRNSQK